MLFRSAPGGSLTGRTLLVASTGGHLEEMLRLRDRLDPAIDDCAWATFDDPQSRSLLAGEQVHYVDYIPPRGYLPLVRGLGSAQHILRSGGYSSVVSTGSGIAIPFMAVARAMGRQCHYIESAARASGPSVTGSVVARVPGVSLYSQYPGWAQGSWKYAGSLFDDYTAEEQTSVEPALRSIDRVVVTLGTMRTYGFRRAVERLSRLLPEVCASGAEVLWQTGSTDVTGLGIAGHDLIPANEMSAAISSADLVIAHAGIGSSLMALDTGHRPVLLPRLSVHGEHVDDHQLLIAGELDQRGLAIGRDVDELTAEDLCRAAATTVSHADRSRPFRLAA